MLLLDLSKEIYYVLNVAAITKNMANYHPHLNHQLSVLVRLLLMSLLLQNHQVECEPETNQKKRYVIFLCIIEKITSVSKLLLFIWNSYIYILN